MKRIVLVLFAFATLGAAALAQAQHIYCKITGHNGVIAGDVTIKGLEDNIAVQSLMQGVTIPIGAASGQATGKRQHKPLTIIKGVDKASPKLFMAAVTGENLSSVDCSFYHRGRGTMQKYFRIALTNARISEINIGNNPNNNFNSQETVSFVFQKITLEDQVSGTIVEDDWESPQV